MRPAPLLLALGVALTGSGCFQATPERSSSAGSTAGGTTTASGSSGTGSISNSSSSGSSSSGGLCGGATCRPTEACCGTKCSDLAADSSNCGACGTLCGAGQICQGSTCQASPCFGAPNCAAGNSCCGQSCCNEAQVCCVLPGPVSTWGCAAADAGCVPGCMGPTCPISSKRYKKDIEYVSPAQRDTLHDELLRLPLATFRYKTEDATARPRLGFMVEDATSPSCVAAPGDRVDLYGYTVAAVQAQEQEIRDLRAEVARLTARLDQLGSATPARLPAPTPGR
jgi:hypothetical protein